jgi:hypothetical protein
MLLKYDVEQTPESRAHSFAIKKRGAPTLRLAADTEEAAARWTTVIREAVERNDQVGVNRHSTSQSFDITIRDDSSLRSTPGWTLRCE